MSRVYEFVIVHDKTKEEKFACIEANDLEEAENALEEKYKDNTESLYELHVVHSETAFDLRELDVEMYLGDIERLYESTPVQMIRKILEIRSKGFAVVADVDNNRIQVFPTLGPTFRRRK